MRDLASFLQGHIDGLRADLEHVLAGRLDTSLLTDAERERVAGYRYAIARLESIANERLADVTAHNAAAMLDEAGLAYQRGLLQGFASALLIIDARASVTGGVFRAARRDELRRIRDRIAGLSAHHRRPTSRPPT